VYGRYQAAQAAVDAHRDPQKTVAGKKKPSTRTAASATPGFQTSEWMKYDQIINNFNVPMMKIFIHKDLLFSLQLPVL